MPPFFSLFGMFGRRARLTMQAKHGIIAVLDDDGAYARKRSRWFTSDWREVIV